MLYDHQLVHAPAFPQGSLSATPSLVQTQAVEFSTAIAEHQARQRAISHTPHPSIVNSSNITAHNLSNWNNPSLNSQQRSIPPALYHSNTTGHLPTSTMAFGSPFISCTFIPCSVVSRKSLTAIFVDMDEHDPTVAGMAGPVDFDNLLSVDELAALNGFRVNDPALSATVSPEDIFIDYSLSAPNSNALTDLTTPSLYDDSPYDVSPALGGANDTDCQNWAPLFNDNNIYSNVLPTPEVPSLEASTSSLSQSQATDMSRTTSTASNPGKDSTLRPRLSTVAGINKASRRTLKDLPPIEVNDDDDKAVKRARNTMAARKSRQKKRDTEDLLREALEAMTADRDHWKMVAISHGAPLPPC